MILLYVDSSSHLVIVNDYISKSNTFANCWFVPILGFNMTRSRRRSLRNNAQKSQEQSPSSTRESTPLPSDPEMTQNNQDACPACTKDSPQTRSVFGKENWILCDHCKAWYHWRCAGGGGDVETVDKWSVQQSYCCPSIYLMNFPGIAGLA